MDSTGEQLHPNWVALSTLHVPLKRFVRAGLADAEKGTADRNAVKYQIDGVSGAEVQKFYKEVLESEPTKADPPKKRCSRRPKEKLQMLPYDKNKYFRLASSNNLKELQQMDIKDIEQLNARDVYGWTALMMAACEGAADVVAWLLHLGVDTKAVDKAGNTALALAQRKGHEESIKLLQTANSELAEQEAAEEEAEAEVAPFYCEICQRDYTESTLREHQTSTVHQFNSKNELPANKLNKFNISLRNRGLQLMIKQGWDREHGLGPTQSGRLYPIKTVLRKRGAGLGIDQGPAKVTHFAAFDLNATKRRDAFPLERRRTRNDMRREKLREGRRERRLRNELS